MDTICHNQSFNDSAGIVSMASKVTLLSFYSTFIAFLSYFSILQIYNTKVPFAKVLMKNLTLYKKNNKNKSLTDLL